MGRKRKRSQKAPDPKDLICRLNRLSKNQRFREAYDDFYDTLFRYTEDHISYLLTRGTGGPPRDLETWHNFKTELNRLRQEVFSIFTHPSAPIVAGDSDFGVIGFSRNLSADGFRKQWGIGPPHPSLLYNFETDRDAWRAPLFFPAAQPLRVFPWTTQAQILSSYKEIKKNSLVPSRRLLPDRTTLLVEFLATEGCDYEAIARGLYPRPQKRVLSFKQEEERMKRELRKGLSYQQAEAKVMKLAQRESPAAARARKQLERLYARLRLRLTRISLPSPSPQ